MPLSRRDERFLYFLRLDDRKLKIDLLGGLSDSDWEVFIEEAARHGLTPLFYHRLKVFPPEAPIPDWVRRRLRLLYLQNAGRTMNLYQGLGKVLEVLGKNDIPVMALKGAHLARLVYGNIALRPMGDLDLLVKKKDLPRVEEKLLEIGLALTGTQKKNPEILHHLVYRWPGKEICVEVHWNIIGSAFPFNVDPEGLWNRARPAVFDGLEIKVLCPEDLLLHLCLHTARDLYQTGLRPFCDLLEVIRQNENKMDWDQVFLRSGEWGIGKFVYLTLKLTRELLGASVPEDLLETIRPHDFEEPIMDWAREQIFAVRARNSASPFISPNVAQLGGQRRLLGKVSLVFERTFPSRQEMVQLYPSASDSPRLSFYYLVRLRDLFLGHRRQVWRLLRRDEALKALARQENNFTSLKKWLGWE
ncbi:MAG: nucleotidyltransferase family protein [Deltaproteobacteria bacterium]|nr:nucleotidyltransferase family protein [Deltaproteobacteria bacterium]